MDGKPTLSDIQNFIMIAELVTGYQRIAKVGVAADLGQITSRDALDEIMLIGNQVMDAIKPTIFDNLEKHHGTAN